MAEAAAGKVGCGMKVEFINKCEWNVKPAPGNKECGGKVMGLLLDRRKNEIWITEKVVMAAARDRGSGDIVMKLLLDQKENEVHITEEIIIAAAGNGLLGTN